VINILGLNYYFHDSTACIVRDGQLVAAVEDERLSRDKHSRAFPALSAAKCLDLAGLETADVDHIAVSIKPTHNWFRRLVYAVGRPRHFGAIYRHEAVFAGNRQALFWQWYRRHWPARRKGPQVHFIPHHMTHAPGSFYVSPFDEAALLGLDGSGEWATTFLGHGQGNSVKCLGESYFPHSLGSFYEAATQFCGFRTNYDEGKTMGLAPMGDPEVFRRQVEEILTIDAEGRLRIDLTYFRFQNMDWRRCSQKFFDTFGEPRKPGAPFEPHHQNLAAAFQRVLEDRVLQICEGLHRKTKTKNLVVSGGVALNSVMNGRLLRESPFESLYVMPAAGDNGTAIGAAFYLWNGILQHPRQFVHHDPYLGTEYTNDQILSVLREAKADFSQEADICSSVADLLVAGKIVGWFQGKMEIGPRSLGGRSILANPAFPEMKDKINAEVKFREAYRPFAPSAPLEDSHLFFDNPCETPFMLKVCNVLPDKRDVIPAVTHVDGSARLQTVRESLHPRYHRLIKTFGQRTGVPVVLNTSFNIQGEPLVESPRDAIRCYFSTGLDALAIGDFLLIKGRCPAS